MVDVMGHFGMALLWALPALVIWNGRASLAFIGLVLATAMLPDVDLVLSQFLPIAYHGITHTILFVVTVGVVAGAVVEYGLKSWFERAWLRSEGHTISTGALFVFVAGALVPGGFSHLFADMLSAPDIAPPVNPFWPVFSKPWSVDVAWYNSPWWNRGLLAVAATLHLLVGYLDFDVDHPYHIDGES